MQYLRLFAVLYVSAFLFGMNVGIQGIVTEISKRGIYSDVCGNSDDGVIPAASNGTANDTAFLLSTTTGNTHQPSSHEVPCVKQEKRIAAIINIMLSVTNMVSLPNGFLIDWIGAEPVTIFAVGTWVVATSMMGISPGNGIVWSIAVCTLGWANSAAFMAFSTFHLREACENDKGKFAFWSTISMAFRAVGALASIPMSYFLSIQSVDFWLLYLLWGVVVGLPVTLVFVWLYIVGLRKKKEKEIEKAAEKEAKNTRAVSHVSIQAPDDEAIKAMNEKEDTPPSKAEKLKKAFADFRAVCFTLAFWTLNLRLTILVTFGSIFIANVGAIARYHGASQSDMAEVRRSFTFILGGLGITNPIPGFLIKRVGTHKGIAIVAGISTIFIGLWLVGCLYDKGEFNWLFYMAFVAFALWRYWGYSVCALYVPTIFPTRQAGFGLIFGSSGAVAGTISVAVGGYVTEVIQNNPDGVVPIVIGIFAFLAFCADIFTATSMGRLMREAKQAEQAPLIPRDPSVKTITSIRGEQIPVKHIDSGRVL